MVKLSKLIGRRRNKQPKESKKGASLSRSSSSSSLTARHPEKEIIRESDVPLAVAPQLSPMHQRKDVQQQREEAAVLIHEPPLRPSTPAAPSLSAEPSTPSPSPYRAQLDGAMKISQSSSFPASIQAVAIHEGWPETPIGLPTGGAVLLAFALGFFTAVWGLGTSFGIGVRIFGVLCGGGFLHQVWEYTRCTVCTCSCPSSHLPPSLRSNRIQRSTASGDHGRPGPFPDEGRNSSNSVDPIQPIQPIQPIPASPSLLLGKKGSPDPCIPTILNYLDSEVHTLLDLERTPHWREVHRKKGVTVSLMAPEHEARLIGNASAALLVRGSVDLPASPEEVLDLLWETRTRKAEYDENFDRSIVLDSDLPARAELEEEWSTALTQGKGGPHQGMIATKLEYQLYKGRRLFGVAPRDFVMLVHARPIHLLPQQQKHDHAHDQQLKDGQQEEGSGLGPSYVLSATSATPDMITQTAASALQTIKRPRNAVRGTVYHGGFVLSPILLDRDSELADGQLQRISEHSPLAEEEDARRNAEEEQQKKKKIGCRVVFTTQCDLAGAMPAWIKREVSLQQCGMLANIKILLLQELKEKKLQQFSPSSVHRD